MATQKITITTVKKLAAEGGWLWDTETAGFGARRQTRDVHFYLRYRLGGKSRSLRSSIGPTVRPLSKAIPFAERIPSRSVGGIASSLIPNLLRFGEPCPPGPSVTSFAF
jgi:hypothetical protein